MEMSTQIFDHDIQTSRPKLLGQDFFDLAQANSFEALAYFLINGQLPKEKELVEFSQRGFQTRRLLAENLSYQAQVTTKVMEVAQSMAGSLNYYYDSWDLMNQLMMTMILFADPQQSALPNYESQVLEFFSESEPENYEQNLEAIRALLTLYIDHGLCASTTVARIIASTKAPTHSAISGAIGALSGPLHGGALEKVVPFLKELTLQNYKEEIDSLFDLGKKIMGFGHTVYKKGDPRSVLAQQIAQSLAYVREDHQLIELAQLVSDYVLEKKGLYPNIDYYSAIALHFLSRQSALSPLFFLFARMPGWIAHIEEQRRLMKA